MDPRARLQREALRLYDRYALEIVEALHICPWAEKARREGRVRRCVVVDAEPAIESLLAEVEGMAEDASIDIGLLICPRVADDRRHFEDRVATLREAHAVASRPSAPSMAMAPFHPVADPDTTRAETLVPFLRRTPDPTIQLVRQRRLDDVRHERDRGTTLVTIDKLDSSGWLQRPPPLHRRIAEANLRSVEALGVAEVERRLRDIRRDRDRSYRELGWM